MPRWDIGIKYSLQVWLQFPMLTFQPRVRRSFCDRTPPVFFTRSPESGTPDTRVGVTLGTVACPRVRSRAPPGWPPIVCQYLRYCDPAGRGPQHYNENFEFMVGTPLGKKPLRRGDQRTGKTPKVAIRKPHPFPQLPRSDASQAYKQASRLLKAGYTKRQPALSQAVLEHPPLLLPARILPSCLEFDLLRPLKKPVATSEKPPPLCIWRTNRESISSGTTPFEAFRPTTSVEGREIEDEHLIRGRARTRLRQRSQSPNPGEYAHVMVYLWATNIDLFPQCCLFCCEPSSTP